MTQPDPVLRRLSRQRRGAWALLWFERLLRAFLPLAFVLALFVLLALAGLFLALPGWAHATLLGGLATAALVALGWGGRLLARPKSAEIDRRLETESGLAHRPLAALDDRPGHDDPQSAALWRAHQARAVAALARLRLFWPRPGLAARDRHALRLALLVGLLAALVVAGPEAPGRLFQALNPRLLVGPGAPDTQVAAWITPPAYTGRAPLFLRPGEAGISVPAGARLVVSVTGGTGLPAIAYGASTLAPAELGPGSWQAETGLPQGGRLEVRRHGSLLAGWDIATIADQPPSVRFPSPPSGLPRSRELRIPYEASDDYGVVALHAELRLKEHPNEAPLALDIPLVGTPKAAHGALQRDLTAHPWAGLPVTIELLAQDAPGQIGRSGTVEITMPERVFRNPLARALVALRKQLSLTPRATREAAGALRALGAQSELTQDDSGVMLNLFAIAGKLRHEHEDGTVAEAQGWMWTLALQLEENAVQRTARALEQAREAARDALQQMREQQPAQQQNGQKNPADAAKQQQLNERLRALREAIQRHMQALAEQAQRDHTLQPFDPNAEHLSSQDIDRMLQQMQQDAQQGRTADAEREMAELENLLDRLQSAEARNGQPNQGRQGQRQRGRQQMGAVQDMEQRESRLQQQAEQRNQPQDAAGQPGRRQDQAVQDALRRALGELMQQFGDLTGQIPQSLGDADQAMREARDALQKGQDSAAAAAQQRAVEALRKGGQEMGQQMAQQLGLSMRPGQPGEQDGDDEGLADGNGDDQPRDGTGSGTLPGQEGRRQGGSRDPLGRLTTQGSSGADEGDDVQLPEQMEQARTRAIQDELRRRGADRTRPAEELRYIDRLLQGDTAP